MQHSSSRKNIRNIIEIVAIVVLCALTFALDFMDITYVYDSLRNMLLSKTVQNICGASAALLLMIRLKIRLFGKPIGWLFLIPCLIIAIDNFQFSAYFNGKIYLESKNVVDILLFASYCLMVGLFEEFVFRGIIFSILAGVFPKNKKGFLYTYVVSSVIFGLAHLLNGFSGTTFLQVGYTVLTGGLFAFCLIKTGNILCCALVHGIYNFCGMLFDKFNAETGVLGLGSGVVFDLGTTLTMLIVSVIVGFFVLYKVFTYKEEEREWLYLKLGVKT